MRVAHSCPTFCDPMDYTVHGILQARILEGVAFPFSGIFPTRGSDPGLPHCRQILYQLSHKRSPRVLEWVAYPFSSGSSWSRNPTGVSCIAGGLFANWAMRKGLVSSIPFSSSCFCPVWPLSSHSHGPRCPSSTVHLLPLPSLSCLILKPWIQASSCLPCAKSCPTLCDPVDYSPPGSSVHRILQEGILEWDAMLSSRGVFLT